MEKHEKIDCTEISPLQLAEKAALALYGKGGFQLKMYHVEDTTVITDYYVIATGRSTTHIKALADEVCYRLDLCGIKAAHVEGRDGGSWILLDFGSVIAHIFARDARDYYNLERLLPEESEIDLAALLKAADDANKVSEK